MIIIDPPKVTNSGERARLESVVTIDGEPKSVFFEVSAEYGPYLCDSRSDAFLVAMLFYALDHGHDIEVKAPVSESLYYQITKVLIDFLVSIYPERGMTPIRITAPLAAGTVTSAGASATGVSCGIDSLATISRHKDLSCGSLDLTHLCFFDTGSHGRAASEKARTLYEERRQNSLNFSREIGLPLVEVVSNLSEVILIPFGYTHTYLDAATVLALQGLFSNYYYSSGARATEFLKFNSDPAYFDIMLLPMLSNRNVTFYSAETNYSRLEKTKLVAGFPLSRRFLNVCNVTGKNCGKCNKCIRTLFAIDALGVVDDFSEVFDLSSYRLNLGNHLVYHYKSYLGGDLSHIELHPLIKKRLNLRHYSVGLFLHLRAVGGRFVRSRFKTSRGS
jgi:hypothetical protein